MAPSPLSVAEDRKQSASGGAKIWWTVKGLIRTALRVLLAGGICAIVLMFVFEEQVDGALRWVGYDGNVVSNFAVVRGLHSRFSLYYMGAASLSIAHFHMLDVVLYSTIVVWGAWLAYGVAFISRYDNELRLFSSYVLQRYRGRRLYLCCSWIFMLSGPIIVSLTPGKRITNPELLFVLAHVPKLSFFIVALAYYLCGGFLWCLSILLLVWMLYRQSRSEAAAPDGTGMNEEERRS